MGSQRRIDANRRNAQQSTGPRSTAGKAASARNATKLNGFGDRCLIATESAAEFIEFARQLRVDLDPRGATELFLVERVTRAAWHLRRLGHFEAALLASEGDNPEGVFYESSRATVEALYRREATLERGLHQTLDRLQRVQAARLGGSARRSGTIDATLSGEIGYEPDSWLRSCKRRLNSKAASDTRDRPPFH